MTDTEPRTSTEARPQVPARTLRLLHLGAFISSFDRFLGRAAAGPHRRGPGRLPGRGDPGGDGVLLRLRPDAGRLGGTVRSARAGADDADRPADGRGHRTVVGCRAQPGLPARRAAARGRRLRRRRAGRHGLRRRHGAHRPPAGGPGRPDDRCRRRHGAVDAHRGERPASTSTGAWSSPSPRWSRRCWSGACAGCPSPTRFPRSPYHRALAVVLRDRWARSLWWPSPSARGCCWSASLRSSRRICRPTT